MPAFASYLIHSPAACSDDNILFFLQNFIGRFKTLFFIPQKSLRPAEPCKPYSALGHHKPLIHLLFLHFQIIKSHPFSLLFKVCRNLGHKSRFTYSRTGPYHDHIPAFQSSQHIIQYGKSRINACPSIICKIFSFIFFCNIRQ